MKCVTRRAKVREDCRLVYTAWFNLWDCASALRVPLNCSKLTEPTAHAKRHFEDLVKRITTQMDDNALIKASVLEPGESAGVGPLPSELAEWKSIYKQYTRCPDWLAKFWSDPEGNSTAYEWSDKIVKTFCSNSRSVWRRSLLELGSTLTSIAEDDDDDFPATERCLDSSILDEADWTRLQIGAVVIGVIVLSFAACRVSCAVYDKCRRNRRTSEPAEVSMA